MAATLLAGFGRPGGAQTVQGQLVDIGTSAPVEGALVLLLSRAGDEVGGYLTNGAGRFIIQAPEAGVFSLRAERIGYETVTSDPFQLDQGQQFGILLESGETAIELEGISVEGSQRCVVRPAEGLQLASVWEEARKALTVQDWTEREGSYRFQVARYERELDALARTVISESRQVQTGVTGVPIRSLPADDLMENGFVRRRDDGGHEYFGPDASVLLSDQFLDTHCFRLAVEPDRPSEVGLAFEPVRLGGVPDITGTLWMDAQTATLSVLEYTYTWAPWEEVRGVAGGRIEFENLPSGAWVIQNWWIRMPLVVQRMDMALLQKTQGIRLTGIKEVGGGITRFTSLDQAQATETPMGVLEGKVWDGTRGAPLAGAMVFLSGTQYSAETDADGRFLIPDLPGGIFSASFTHPRLDSLGVFSSGKEVEIVPGEFTDLTLDVPSTAGVMTSTCTEEELQGNTTAVIGFVREGETEAPMAGATVMVTWSIFGRRADGRFIERRDGLETTSDSTGRYSACGVPFDTLLRVKAIHGDRETETIEVEAERRGFTVINLIIPG